MARPVNANADETRHKLLDGAIALFARLGFHGASTRELTGAARVNIATLNYYFDSKQGLYDAAVDNVYRRLAARTRAELGAALPQDLDQLVAVVYAAARAERDGIRLLVRQIVDHGRLTARTESKHFLPGIETVTALAVARTGCTHEQARAAAVALGYAISRFVIQDDASLKSAFGLRTAADAHARVVAILATTARALLASPAKKKNKE